MPISAIVIGAGIVGSAVAWELAAAGHSVHLIDARQPGQGATRASAGVLAPFIEGHDSSLLRDLGRRSLAMFDEFVHRVRADSVRAVLYQRTGTLEVALSADEAERLRTAATALGPAGINARWLPPSSLAAHQPLVSAAAFGGLLIAEHGFAGVRSLTDALVAAARGRGAELTVETGTIRVRPRSGGGLHVDSGERTWAADRVVLAAGSWSSHIVIEGVEPVPVTPIRGQLLQFRLLPGALRQVIWGQAGYLVPWPDGSVLAGATVEDVGFDERPTDAGIAQMRAMAVALVPALAAAPLEDVRVGLRPRGPDDLPIVGASSIVPDLIYATGHYRNGVLLAPLTAALVRTIVEGGTDLSLAQLSPARCNR